MIWVEKAPQLIWQKQLKRGFNMKLIECVPNFSEGKDKAKIQEIANAIKAVEGVNLLDIDPGEATNRTVITFVGTKEAVLEGAFQGIKKASEIIDMRKHKGEHPRMGATDVCPFIPLSGSTMDDCIEIAKKLGKRVWEELKIPIYLYEYAATTEERRSLANIREGEYEGLEKKLKDPKWKPDFGEAYFNEKSGATVIGARNFLIAYNINLNTRDKRLANSIANKLREKGTIKKDKKGNKVLDENGNPIYEPGFFKDVRAVGWYIDEYGCAQISINVLNYKVSPLYKIYDKTEEIAKDMGLKVIGSEIVGLVPKEAILEAGEYYLKKQGKSRASSEDEKVHIAIKSLGLSSVQPFNPKEKIIEYKIGMNKGNLIEMNLKNFCNELASSSPAPGGGSVAALCGALGSSLSSMVSNLTYDTKGYEKYKNQMEEIGIEAQKLKDKFLKLVDEDTNAFNNLMKAMRMPKKTDEEREMREKTIKDAIIGAIEVPLEVLINSAKIPEMSEILLKKGNQNALSDSASALLVCYSSAYCAYFNILINLKNLEEKEKERYLKEADDLINKIEKEKKSLLKKILKKLTQFTHF